MTTASALTKPAQIRVARRSPAYWRVTIDNPPINVMGPEMVRQFQKVIDARETDEHVRVVVFDSAVDDYFLNHSDFLAKRGPDRTAAGSHRLAALAGLSRAPDPLASRLHRPHPWPGDGQRQRDRAGLRHEFRQPRKGHPFARAIRRPGWDQSADGARLPQARGMSKIGSDTTWAKSRPRPAPDAILNSGTLRMGGSKPILADMFRKPVVMFYIFCTKEVCMSQKASAVKRTQQSEVQPHQLGQVVFKTILSEDVDSWVSPRSPALTQSGSKRLTARS
jgi:hypothetical protein